MNQNPIETPFPTEAAGNVSNLRKLSLNLSSRLTITTTTPVPELFQVTPETLIISAEHENSSSLTHFSDRNNASPESLSFILVPVLVILVVALFSGLAIHCIQRRQRLDSLRHTLIPMYVYNREDDEWGFLLDNGRRSRY